MVISNMYERRFTKFINIQEESKLEYSMVETETKDGMMYGMKIACEKDGNLCSDMIQFFSKSRDLVVGILTYLYENAVTLITWRYVISDLSVLDFR